MNVKQVLRGTTALNLCGLWLGLRNRAARVYLSDCLRRYQELAGLGLPHRDPRQFLVEQGWGAHEQHATLPTQTDLRGGVQLDEMVIIATTTRILAPRKIFEIGTYNGQTTAVLVLNSPADARVLTMDLPPDVASTEGVTHIDLGLIANREVGIRLKELGLQGRAEQVFCDSMAFDPSPHRGSVELGFIDGAHSRAFVENDTVKMADMMAERGIVFWHDYRGQGALRPLGEYLESLARKIPIYSVHGTSLAWASAPDVRRIL